MLGDLEDLNDDFASQLTTNDNQIKEIRRSLQTRIAGIAHRLLEQEVNVDHQLMEYGMTSSQAVDFAAEVEHAFGLSIPSTLIFDYPTIDDVSSFLEGKINSPEMPTEAHTKMSDHSIRDLISTSLEEEVGFELDDTLSGLNSSQAVAFVTKLNTMLDLELPSTLVFDYPNIDGIVSAISSKMELPIESSQYLPAMAAITDKDEASHFKRCYLVAYFSSMDSQQQVKGKAVSEDLISRIPLGRWDCGWNSIHEHLPVFGYFLEDIEHFDPTMFRISELEAVEMDPQQRKLLGSWSNCHYNMSVPKETGIYVGVSQLD
jgi:acyl carrier protein